MDKILEVKYFYRDKLIREIWCIMNEISRYTEAEGKEMSNEDLAVWGEVTIHSAVQSRLDAIAKDN